MLALRRLVLFKSVNKVGSHVARKLENVVKGWFALVEMQVKIQGTASLSKNLKILQILQEKICVLLHVLPQKPKPNYLFSLSDIVSSRTGSE